MPSDVQMLKVQDVPGRVLRKVNADARRRGVSINDAVVAVLASRFDLTVAESGSKFTVPVTGTMLNLRLPRELHRRLKTHSASTGAPMRAVVVGELARHHGLPAETRR